MKSNFEDDISILGLKSPFFARVSEAFLAGSRSRKNDDTRDKLIVVLVDSLRRGFLNPLLDNIRESFPRSMPIGVDINAILPAAGRMLQIMPFLLHVSGVDASSVLFALSLLPRTLQILQTHISSSSLVRYAVLDDSRFPGCGARPTFCCKCTKTLAVDDEPCFCAFCAVLLCRACGPDKTTLFQGYIRKPILSSLFP